MKKSSTIINKHTEIQNYLTLITGKRISNKEVIKEMLNTGTVHLPSTYDFINFLNSLFTEHQKDFLNLKPNCYLQNKHNQQKEQNKRICRIDNG